MILTPCTRPVPATLPPGVCPPLHYITLAHSSLTEVGAVTADELLMSTASLPCALLIATEMRVHERLYPHVTERETAKGLGSARSRLGIQCALPNETTVRAPGTSKKPGGLLCVFIAIYYPGR